MTLSASDIEAIASLVAPMVAEILSPETPRRARAPEPPRRRDLAAELETGLHARGLATVPELARLARARDADVRATLARDSRFVRVPPSPERSPKARPWALGAPAVHAGRTSQDDPPSGHDDRSMRLGTAA